MSDRSLSFGLWCRRWRWFCLWCYLCCYLGRGLSFSRGSLGVFFRRSLLAGSRFWLRRFCLQGFALGSFLAGGGLGRIVRALLSCTATLTGARTAAYFKVI